MPNLDLSRLGQRLDPRELPGRVERDVRRGLARARNGATYVAGRSRPEVGATPKDTVWRRDKAELWRYRSDAEHPVRCTTPVLIVMSLVSRSYILDLYPGASFVQRLREAGFDVYLLDWGIPDEREAANSLSTYVDELLPPAIDAVLAESGAGSVNLIGYCLGGVLSALLGAAHPELPVASLVCMATPVVYGEMGVFSKLFESGRLDPDDVIDDTGNVPPDVIRTGFRMLQPTGDVATYAVLWEKLPNSAELRGFQAMNQWTRDHIPFPGQAFRELTDIMRDDSFVHDRVRLGDRQVSLRELTWPLLNVVAQKDHIVPCAAALPLPEMVGSETAETLELPSGHVALVMGRAASTVTMPRIVDWLHRYSAC